MAAKQKASGRRRLWRAAALLVSAFLGVYVVIPQIPGLESTGRALLSAPLWVPVLAVGLEASSLATYAEIELVALRADGMRPRRSLVQRTTVVGTSLGRTLPGGTATALALVVGALSRSGLPAASVTGALAATGVLSSVVLALLLVPAALLALAGGAAGTLAAGALGAAGAVIAGAALLPLVLRKPAHTAGLVKRALVPLARGPLRRRLDPDALAETVRAGLRSARGLLLRRHATLRALGWATANWLTDAAALLVVTMTVGTGVPLTALLLAYIVGQLAAAVPLTPGGVGVVEAGMVATLVAAGAPAAAATAAVLGWRLVSHWLPIVAGLVLVPSVVGGRRVRGVHRRS